MLSTSLHLAAARIGSHRKLNSANKAIPGQYLVKMENVGDLRGALNGILHANDNARIRHTYREVFQGFLLSHVNDAALRRLLDSSLVKMVFEVSSFYANTMPSNGFVLKYAHETSLILRTLSVAQSRLKPELLGVLIVSTLVKALMVNTTMI